MNPQKKYALIDTKGRYYHFWDKEESTPPKFGDYLGAKKLSASGCASSQRLLQSSGYAVTRVPVLNPFANKATK